MGGVGGPVKLVLAPLTFTFLLTLVVLLTLGFAMNSIVNCNDILFVGARGAGSTSGLFVPSSGRANAIGVGSISFPARNGICNRVLVSSINVSYPLVCNSDGGLL